MRIYIFLLAIMVLSFAFGDDKLYHVFTIVSQGTTTPDYPVPTMDWNDWEEKGPNELTAMGMREQYLLGHELRRRYSESKFIDFDYVIDQVLVQMIDHNYTITSGEAFIRGFLGNSVAVLNEDELKVADPPIPIDPYFKNKIRNNVLPAGIATLPFHTFYPHSGDVFAPRFCPKAQQYNLKAFETDSLVQEWRQNNEAKFIDLAKTHYQFNATFPSYMPFLESIASVIHQQKELNLSVEEAQFIKNARDTLYYPYRVLNETATLYRLSGVFEYVGTAVNKSVRAIIAHPDSKQARKAVFFFTKDIMLASLVKVLGGQTDKIVAATSIISFEVYGPESNPSLDNLSVKIRKNDDEPMKTYAKFVDFLNELSKLIKPDYKEWCTK